MKKVSYKKLWKLLIDRDMSCTELRLKAGISSVSLAKLGKNEGGDDKCSCKNLLCIGLQYW